MACQSVGFQGEHVSSSNRRIESNLWTDAALFGRAALVARDQERFEVVTELTEEERSALAYERDHKWHGPAMLWYSISLCAVGAATQGWDQTCV